LTPAPADCGTLDRTNHRVSTREVMTTVHPRARDAWPHRCLRGCCARKMGCPLRAAEWRELTARAASSAARCPVNC